MKTKLKYLVISLTALLLMSCVDIFTRSETLVFRYTSTPWVATTKALSVSDNADIRGYYRYYHARENKEKKDWMYVDHVICMILPWKCDILDEEEHKTLSKKHGDKGTPFGALFTQIGEIGLDHTFYKDLDYFQVTCTEDFDPQHPAGSSLLDIIHFANNSVSRVLKNDFQVWFDDQSLWLFYQDFLEYLTLPPHDVPKEQLFNNYKYGTEVLKEDLSMLSDFYLYFEKFPEPAGPRTIQIRLTAEDGIVYEYETVLTFEKVAGLNSEQMLTWL